MSYKSRGSRRERDFFFQNLMFREGNENYKIKSHGRARKNQANSHENPQDREFSLVFASNTLSCYHSQAVWNMSLNFNALLAALSMMLSLSNPDSASWPDRFSVYHITPSYYKLYSIITIQHIVISTVWCSIPHPTRRPSNPSTPIPLKALS